MKHLDSGPPHSQAHLLAWVATLLSILVISARAQSLRENAQMIDSLVGELPVGLGALPEPPTISKLRRKSDWESGCFSTRRFRLIAALVAARVMIRKKDSQTADRTLWVFTGRCCGGTRLAFGTRLTTPRNFGTDALPRWKIR